MNWYRDISKRHTELGVKEDPTMAFLKPFAIFLVVGFLLTFICFLLMAIIE